MQVVKLKHIKSYRAGGRVYHYHRITGARLPDDESERARRVLEINSGLDCVYPRTMPGSLRDLILQYRRSPDFKELAISSQKSYDTYLDLLLRAYPDKPVETISRAWLYELRDAMADTPRAANWVLQLMSILMNFARDRGWRGDNPAQGVKKLKRGRSYEPWPESAIERFRREARPRMALALELAVHSGQRLSDVLAMQWRHVGNGLIEVAQSKTDERLSIPLHRDLRQLLERTPRTGMYIVCTERGTPYTRSGFSKMFRRELERLNLRDFQFHGLRHTAGRRLAEAGCSDREIAAILGHRTAAMTLRYTRRADQKRLAKAAVTKLERG